MAQVLTIGGIEVQSPTNFQIEKYNITKAGRVATGDMTLEYIAGKRKFIFEYNSIRGDYLDIILDIIYTPTMFFTLTYKENDVVKSATVYAGAVKSEQFRTDGSWVWKNVSFSLIEK